ncbi:LysM peptidoglycan-binding domain-containing protein [Gulosibacter bifidus]|uniref:LysM peptidoglycan-binding domain-containing protein n=1 Tax=Gulosibacter bifidus TaxID=272239 RepID=A0ABW5RKJ1_9MICO|nr:LysM peptidoglycan-binding domain-containing protein [Gulosibacter bifidus]
MSAATITNTEVTATTSAAATLAAARRNAGKLRLTVRGRRVLASLLLAPFAVVGGFALTQVEGAAADNAAHATGAESFKTHTVLAGESLWDIAEEIADGRDIRDVVAEIQRLNVLDSASLSAGQEIALPNY